MYISASTCCCNFETNKLMRFSETKKKFSWYQKGGNVKTFLTSFGWTYRDCGVQEKDRIIYLCPQICAGLSEVYSEMRDEETSDVLLFKESVNITYGLMSISLCSEFRQWGWGWWHLKKPWRAQSPPPPSSGSSHHAQSSGGWVRAAEHPLPALGAENTRYATAFTQELPQRPFK